MSVPLDASTSDSAARVRAKAARMRYDIVEMIAEAGSGHPGGSLSAADIVATLYFGDVMRHDPAHPDWPERDRFVLSKGHAAPVLYAALAESGYFGREHLATLRKLGSILQGHPDSKKTPGVEVSTGSLGQGLSIACGIALGLLGGEQSRADEVGRAGEGTGQDAGGRRTVYCLLGDGECQEGQVWEAAMFAAHHGLDNLVAIVDNNGLQIDGACSDVMCLGEIAREVLGVRLGRALLRRTRRRGVAAQLRVGEAGQPRASDAGHHHRAHREGSRRVVHGRTRRLARQGAVARADHTGARRALGGDGRI